MKARVSNGGTYLTLLSQQAYCKAKKKRNGVSDRAAGKTRKRVPVISRLFRQETLYSDASNSPSRKAIRKRASTSTKQV